MKGDATHGRVVEIIGEELGRREFVIEVAGDTCCDVRKTVLHEESVIFEVERGDSWVAVPPYLLLEVANAKVERSVANTRKRIQRNGDNFLITRSSVNLFGNSQTTTVPAVVKDGLLQVQGGFGTATITYVKAADRVTAPALLGGNVEYERVK